MIAEITAVEQLLAMLQKKQSYCNIYCLMVYSVHAFASVMCAGAFICMYSVPDVFFKLMGYTPSLYFQTEFIIFKICLLFSIVFCGKGLSWLLITIGFVNLDLIIYKRMHG